MKLKNIINILLPAAFFAVLMGVSCSRNDAQKPPVIESVRITDPEKADSTFTQALPGKMIVIQGKHLAHALDVYINDQSVTFNPNMNTDHSIVVKIPTEADGFELTVWNRNLKPEIKVVTAAGSANYAFKVLAPSPSITRIAGKYPRNAGDKLTVIGINFLDLERVYFDTVNPYGKDVTGKGKEVDVTDYTIEYNRYYDEKGSQYVTDSDMTLTLPELGFNEGYLVLEAPQGHAVIEYAALPPAPTVSGISSDMPVPGSRVYIRGTYFVAVTGIKFGNDVVVGGEDITVSDDESELSFIMPAKPAASTTISVVTPGGESNALPFCRYETLIVDFDTLGKDRKWDPDAEYRTGDGVNPPYVSDGMFGIFDCVNPGGNWWGTMIYWESSTGTTFTFPDYDVIPEDTPASDLYLMYECYNSLPFTQILHYQWQDTGGKSYVWQNWESGHQIIPELLSLFDDLPYDNWYTAKVPMSRFNNGMGDMTYGQIKALGIKNVRLMLHNHGSVPETVFLCIDNIRLSTLPTLGLTE